jgi:hypothetical protein
MYQTGEGVSKDDQKPSLGTARLLNTGSRTLSTASVLHTRTVEAFRKTRHRRSLGCAKLPKKVTSRQKKLDEFETSQDANGKR